MKARLLGSASLGALASLLAATNAFAQEPPPLPADPNPSAPMQPAPPVTSAPPATPPPPVVYDTTPLVDPAAPAGEPPPSEPREEPMSEGRRIVVAWNTGFQWGISPGVFIRDGEASFALGLRFGYGFDTGSVILVPDVRLAGYFADPNVYVGMPVMKLVLPIDRFAPFLEAGAGAGYQDSTTETDSAAGVALMAGGGFMVHFTLRFGLGVEANYQTVTGTSFHGFGVGPILALGF